MRKREKKKRGREKKKGKKEEKGGKRRRGKWKEKDTPSFKFRLTSRYYLPGHKKRAGQLVPLPPWQHTLLRP